MAGWNAPALWQDGECWIIGGGPSMPEQFDVPKDIAEQAMARQLKPSAYSKYLSAIHNKHIIGINNAYQIGEWVDVVFFGDCGWYKVHQKSLAEFPGLKVTCCPRFANKPKQNSHGVKYLSKDPNKRHGISMDSSKVSWNSNSGSAAISLARHFGVKRIILLGFDMCLNGQKISHWHGNHGNKTRSPFPRHMRGFAQIAKDAEQEGIEIINASPNSAIQQFRKVSVKELL